MRRATTRAATRWGTAGVVAALACTLGCCLPAVLIAFGAGGATAGMAGMGESHPAHGTLAGLLHVLHRISPGLLMVSIVLIAGAFALRRPIAVIPALLAGVVLYASVHGQSDPIVSYAGMAVGYGSWVGLYLWTRPGNRNRSCTAGSEADCR